MVLMAVRLCWECYRAAQEDEALVRACCDCDALVYFARALVSRGSWTLDDIDLAAAMFLDARQQSLAAVKAFLVGGKKPVEP